MKQFIRDYFTFDKQQRRGVFILLSIILVLLLYLSFSDFFFPKEQIDFSAFEKDIALFEAEMKRAQDSVAEVRKNYFSKYDDEDSVKRFNKPAERNKQGKYQFENKFPKKDVSVMVELNGADTTALKQLRGIGSVFAKRIVKFRDALGGFLKKEQLLEVHGFDKEKYDTTSPQVEIDVSKVKLININSASVETLNKHPYIDKKTAVKIFFQRVNNGNYSDVSDIRKLNLADEEVYTKIAPYLTTK